MEKKRNELPFSLVELECPICGKVNQFENVKVGAYQETEIDTDFKPKKRVWVNPEYQLVNPLLYFMATCSNCFYTHEFDLNFKKWGKEENFKTPQFDRLKEQHLRELNREKSWLKKLGTNLDQENRPFETAVLKFLLGIFDEKLLANPSGLNLGRYFLRIAWLFREAQESHYHLKMVEKTEFRNWQEKLWKFKEKLDALNQDIEELEKYLGEDFIESNSPQENEEMEKERLYESALKEMKKNLSFCALSWGKMWEDSQNFEKLASHMNVPLFCANQEFSGYSTFENFLNELKKDFEEVPRNENEALQSALKYYKGSFEKSKKFSSENQKIQSAYLLGELSERTGELIQAQEYFTQARDFAKRFIEQNQSDYSKTALAQKILKLAERENKSKTELIKTEEQK
jgi:uncharacterized protein (DUF2225 family)